MLKVNNIEVVFSSVILTLRGVSLSVDEGQMVALLGANGAGKTTTLKAISGLLKTELGEVTHGSVLLDEDRIDDRSPQHIARLGIAQILEGRRIYSHLTTEENLRLGAYLTRSSTRKKTRMKMVYRYFPQLEHLRNNVSGYLSGGEQQQLVVGRGLMSEPRLMLVDEASLGLAPLLINNLFEAFVKINKEEKIGMLLVEQNAQIALKVSSFGYVMENGRVVLDGLSEKLLENEDIKEFYLGLGQERKKSYKDVKHYKRRKRWLG
ncbi:MAG: ABC transporter ATP-binding protein [Deltaproteobacteria bacterium]|nr:ABC transporter ATP-binding protein [Deltaproteobacteria bacterium]